MDPLWNRYYRVNRIFLLPIGLWPHGHRKLKPIQVIVSVVILVSSVVTQLLKLFTMEYDIDFILTDLAFAVPSMIFVVKYKTFYSQANRLFRMMELIQDDWNSLTGEEEIHILQKYTDMARRYIIAFAFILCSSIVCFILLCCLPNILDFVAPLNESRPRKLPFLAEYFVDQQKYFNFILMHMIVVVIVDFFIFMGTETISFVHVYHMLGMFKVVSYRVKHVFDENIELASIIEWNIYVRARIIAAIKVHQRAIRFFDYLMTTLKLSSFIVLCLGVASVSINLYRTAIVEIKGNNRNDVALFTMFLSGHLSYMFVGNYVGQKIIDHSMHIVDETYDIPWYEAPVQTQKLLLFIMQRSMRSCKFVLGGVYTVSMEGFATLSSMSMTYFTMLCSI